ncbi:hypothetical protein [Alterinioella nitratireducens]|uniref:hypothetical protein n=1 Tax=Alterinioella nitratireducens TaxID=2735915 RepID=UPI001557FEFB|nr:hypothetical protein [Alterinioella nitratireducens]NPD19731.1 hypothetical protein [Alterinioella nitratireducens]
MSNIIDEMRAHGIFKDVSAADTSDAGTSSAPLIASELAFSGYGVFTPITVSSSTVFGNANLERNKQRD